MKKSYEHISVGDVARSFWPGVRPSASSFFFVMAVFIIGEIVHIIVPLFYKQFFDLIATATDRSLAAPMLIQIIAVIALLHGVNWLCYRTGMFVYLSASTATMAKLRQVAFDHLMLHSYSFFSNNFTGSLVQRVSRFARAFERIADSIVFNVIQLTIGIVGAIIVLANQAPLIALVILGWVCGFMTFNYLFSRWRLKYNIQSAEADSRTTGYLSDDITNHNAVTLFTNYAYEKDRFKDVTEDQARIATTAWRLAEIVDAVQMLFLFIVEFCVFYYAIVYWEKGAFTLGTFVLIQVYIIGLGTKLWGFSRIIRNMHEGIADAKEMADILLMPHEVKDSPGARTLAVAEGRVEFKDVTFAFNETRDVLDHVSIALRGGEKVALVGPSGAGKTTIVKLLLRLYDVSSGAIEIDGQNIARMTQESVRRAISMVPQDPVLFHRTLMENIRYGRRDATDEEVISAAKLAHCDDFIEALPQKYDTYVGERGIKLSGGERQRVAIARAILKNAPILILDEATSSLDSRSEALIQDALDALMRGKTVVVIAHRLSTIRKMDRILVLEAGSVREEGTHESLIAEPESLYAKLWNLQAGGFIK